MDEDTDVQRSDRSLKEDSCLWDGGVEQEEKQRTSLNEHTRRDSSCPS